MCRHCEYSTHTYTEREREREREWKLNRDKKRRTGKNIKLDRPRKVFDFFVMNMWKKNIVGSKFFFHH